MTSTYGHNKLALRQAAAEPGRAVYGDELRTFVASIQAARGGVGPSPR